MGQFLSSDFRTQDFSPPSCNSFDFDKSAIEYALFNLEKPVGSKRFSSMVWKMAEVPSMLMEEEASYPMYAFFADVGGSLGNFNNFLVESLKML